MKRIMNTFVQKRDGFTLVEVLAAVVIISIILIGVVNLLNFTNKTAYSNNAKLVSINLAKASIERIKIQPNNYFNVEDIEFTSEDCSPSVSKCTKIQEQIIVNDQTYDVEFQLSQSKDEAELQLINTVVTVELVNDDKRTIESTVEGYINLTRVNASSEEIE